MMPIVGPPLPRTLTPADFLAAGLSAKPEAIALASAEKSWTWRELDDLSRNLAGNLLALGLKPGDRVASLMPNRGEVVIHYLACLKAGLAATPLNYRYQPSEIDHALQVSGASILLFHSERAEDIRRSKLASKLPCGQICYGAARGEAPRFEDLLREGPSSVPLPTPAGGMPSFIFFTSGSTGKPKGVTHTHATLGAMIASAILALETTPDDVFLPGSSISHIGATLITFAGLAAGARVDVARTFDGDELLPLLVGTRPTLLCMLPAALFAVVRDHGATRESFSSLRICIAGGDKVAAELEREFTGLAGFEIEEIYGMSEIGLATVNPPSGINKIGSIGKLGPGYQASIRDEQGQEVSRGAEGRLWIASPCNMVGYWNRPDATAETIVDGWVDTGDVVKADDDEYLWFCGRKKQIIVHDGSNICPQEVEESLMEHPAIAEAGVVGIHDLVHGENVRAYISLKAGADRPTVAELVKFSRERVGYKAPEEIVILAEMPLNATGKVDRVALKRRAETSLATGAME